MIPPPTMFGAPAQFSSWRPEQEAALGHAFTSGKEVDGLNLPVGSGKTLFAWGAAQLFGGRTVVLTSTKGLQDQYEESFRDAGLKDLRGMGNYPCRALNNREKCDAGPCLDGEQCQWRSGGCDYFDAEAAATESPLATTNYSWWFSHPDSTLGGRDILIADEAHALPDEIAKAAGAFFSEGDVEIREEMRDWPLAQWQAWAYDRRMEAEAMLALEGYGAKDRRMLRQMVASTGKVLSATDDTWAWEWDYNEGGMRFEPIVPTEYTRPLLMRGIKKVILMSGTLREYMLKDLGLNEQDYSFYEIPSPFPPENRPIYWVKMGYKVNNDMSEGALRHWVHTIDTIIADRLPWKGIIHTVSYARMRYLREHSRFAKLMTTHNAKTTAKTVEAFRAASQGILVSPSVHTGWDFPYDAARWQVIAKVPWPVTASGIASVRQARDPRWNVKQAITTIQQMVGRVARAQDDVGETLITDDSIDFLFRHFRPWFAKSFREAFQPVTQVPRAIMLR